MIYASYVIMFIVILVYTVTLAFFGYGMLPYYTACALLAISMFSTWYLTRHGEKYEKPTNILFNIIITLFLYVPSVVLSVVAFGSLEKVLYLDEISQILLFVFPAMCVLCTFWVTRTSGLDVYLTQEKKRLVGNTKLSFSTDLFSKVKKVKQILVDTRIMHQDIDNTVVQYLSGDNNNINIKDNTLLVSTLMQEYYSSTGNERVYFTTDDVERLKDITLYISEGNRICKFDSTLVRSRILQKRLYGFVATIVYYAYKNDPDNLIYLCTEFRKLQLDYNVKQIIANSSVPVTLVHEGGFEEATSLAEGYFELKRLTHLTADNINQYVQKFSGDFIIDAKFFRSLSINNMEKIRSRIRIVYNSTRTTYDMYSSKYALISDTIVDGLVNISSNDNADIKIEDTTVLDAVDVINESRVVNANFTSLEKFYDIVNLMTLLLVGFAPFFGIMTPYIIPVLIVYDYFKNVLLPVSMVGCKFEFNINKVAKYLITISSFLLFVLIIYMSDDRSYSTDTENRRIIFMCMLSLYTAIMYIGATHHVLKAKTYITLAIMSFWYLLISLDYNGYITRYFTTSSMSTQGNLFIHLMLLLFLPIVLISSALIPDWKVIKEKFKKHE